MTEKLPQFFERVIGTAIIDEDQTGFIIWTQVIFKPAQGVRKIGQRVLFIITGNEKDIGYQFTILETGKGQPEAIGLYLKKGYHITENYGQYKGIENSVCFKKELID